jgi:hypothetical protein
MNCEEGDSVIEIEGFPTPGFPPLWTPRSTAANRLHPAFSDPVALVREAASLRAESACSTASLSLFRPVREKGGRLPLEEERLYLEGGLSAGKYALPGNVSSQFVTGLMLALPLLKGDR